MGMIHRLGLGWSTAPWFQLDRGLAWHDDHAAAAALPYDSLRKLQVPSILILRGIRKEAKMIAIA